jgi:Mg/Co/Ni transporter MgtE
LIPRFLELRGEPRLVGVVTIGVDPAVVSAPLVTTLVDATGLLIYFGIAQLLVL